MIFLITERHETIKEQYTDVLGKSKFDRMLLSMDCRENLGPIHPRKSLIIIIINSGGSSYRDMGIIPTNKFKLIFCFHFVFKILSLLLLTVLNFVIVVLHDTFS